MNIRSFGQVVWALAGAITLSGLVAGCAGAPDDGDAPFEVELTTGPELSISRDDTTWTTTNVCTACGCTVSGFACDCGLRPTQKKIDCIKNGGPSKVLSSTFIASP